MKKILLLSFVMMTNYQSFILASASLESKKREYQLDSHISYGADDNYNYHSSEDYLDDSKDYQINTQPDVIDKNSKELNDNNLDYYNGGYDHQFNDEDRSTFTIIMENNLRLKDAFNFIREHKLGSDIFFGDFLKKEMTKDGYDIGEMNFSAYAYIADHMKDHFILVLQDAIANNARLEDIQDPIFLYCMSLRNDFMQDFICNWIDEIYNFRTGFSFVPNNSFKNIIEDHITDDNFNIISSVILVKNSLIDQIQPIFMNIVQDVQEANIITNEIVLYSSNTLWIQKLIKNWNLPRITPGQFINKARQNDVQSIALFIAFGGDVNITEHVGSLSALMTALNFGAQDVLSFLLNRPDIDVNYQDQLSRTALILAVTMDRNNVIQLLLNHPNIDINLSSRNGWCPLYIACNKRNIDIVTMLLADPRINVNNLNSVGGTSLMIASMHGDVGIVKAMLAHKDIQVNVQDNQRWSALMKAADKGNTEVVALLLDAGANPDFTDNNGFNAFLAAAKDSETSTVQVLLPRIHDKDVVDKQGRSALFYAAKNGHLETVQFLITQGVNRALADRNGNTALDVARNDQVRAILSA